MALTSAFAQGEQHESRKYFVYVVCAPSSGSLFPIGTTVVSCTATDNAELATTDTFNVRVQMGIIWIEPLDDPHTDTIGPNLNLRWGYGFGITLLESGS